MKMVCDAGAVNWSVDSDDRAVSLRLGIGEVQWLRPQEPPMRVDSAVLRDPEKNKAMQEIKDRRVQQIDKKHNDK